MPSNKRALIERWQTGPGLELAQQLKACWLFGREPYPLLPLEKHNGRWDFRGLDVTILLPPVIPLPDGTALDMREYRNAAHGDRPDSFNGVHFVDCDFSFACLEDFWFEACVLDNILFYGANGTGFHDEASTFRQVDFTRTRWYGATLGLRGARYERCLFEKTDLRRVFFYCGYFTDCHFNHATWSRDVSLEGSHFIRSKISGKIWQIFFKAIEDPLVNDLCGYIPVESNSPVDLDLSAAQVEELLVIGPVDVSQVILSQDGNALLIRDWRAGARKLAQMIRAGWGDTAPQAEAHFLDKWLKYSTSENSGMQFVTRYQLDVTAWDIEPAEEKARVVENFWTALLQISAEE
jgi:hypothetical protein